MRFLTLIFGTVGSGKTAELLRLVSKLEEHNSRCRLIEKRKFTVFKPVIETRSDQITIISRSGQAFDKVVAVSDINDLVRELDRHNPDIIVIEECQFFEIGAGNEPQAFILLIRKLLESKKQVILCGLIQNCYGGQFEISSSLCPEADEIINPHTTCHCGQVASRSQRLQIGYSTPITDPVFIVDDDSSHNLGYSYEPRCNNCW
ncbi:MAG: hypothetical protein A3B89_01390 [Candidatus Buchananbacteria bacterium RIFCSPHIGHO2_02_FULL_40_13]|uniref:Thymidine kinase n=1 Tax=Candidatus Buchananbacteria bacterium RIFCSPLOWO2_01_FULL_39_33 TaxID=1797543 RepID=A0A1G1YLH6_9BACT|nr:MAG: hypothetical protein A2820_03545 [Candidatus Buchananbacteria bacterium RIFCSPHIGHO2_01_FULL_40_35]OGY50141.1 MAG: hypothetical protein A3B89_01390 [Candidatus Buchananbacteria bacterium RIFCSPHIGHO2_02_FULL_40_13]OGY53124.1 MAG: hypothetical protein A3A02_00205 [Candidatus Buchananbacteria bacterium RIFCSPLOWO2_01_FULL_39_33]